MCPRHVYSRASVMDEDELEEKKDEGIVLPEEEVPQTSNKDSDDYPIDLFVIPVLLSRKKITKGIFFENIVPFLDGKSIVDLSLFYPPLLKELFKGDLRNIIFMQAMLKNLPGLTHYNSLSIKAGFNFWNIGCSVGMWIGAALTFASRNSPITNLAKIYANQPCLYTENLFFGYQNCDSLWMDCMWDLVVDSFCSVPYDDPPLYRHREQACDVGRDYCLDYNSAQRWTIGKTTLSLVLFFTAACCTYCSNLFTDIESDEEVVENFHTLYFITKSYLDYLNREGYSDIDKMKQLYRVLKNEWVQLQQFESWSLNNPYAHSISVDTGINEELVSLIQYAIIEDEKEPQVFKSTLSRLRGSFFPKAADEAKREVVMTIHDELAGAPEDDGMEFIQGPD